MTHPTSEPWRMWILHSPERGTLGREIRYGWSMLELARDHADVRLRQFNIRLEHDETGERWERVGGHWREVPIAPPPLSTGTPPAAPSAEPPVRAWWQDRD